MPDENPPTPTQTYPQAPAPPPAQRPPSPPPSDRRDSELVRTADQRRKWKEAARTLAAERDAARTEAAAATAKAEKAHADLAAMKSQLHTAKHRAVADRILEEEGIREGAADAFYKLSEMEFAGDTPDPARLKTAILEAKGKLAYLFGDGRRPAPGSGQGGNGRGPAGKVPVTRGQLATPAYCYSEEWAALQKSGNYEIVE